MKLASHLWQSRHGIFYYRLLVNGKERRISLRTRNRLQAIRYAYKLNSMAKDDILNKINSGNIKTWTYEIGGARLSTDGTEEDHLRAKELALMLQKNQLANPNIIPSSVDKAAASVISIDEAVRRYLEDRADSVATRTLSAWKSDFRRLVDGIGPTSKLADITPDSYSAWRKKTIDHLAPKSQNSKYSAYKTFFEWCISRRYCTASPITKLKLSPNQRQILDRERGKERQPYEYKDLVKLFSPDAVKKIKKPCLFWMPLIALYTGARAEEIANIHLDSIELHVSGFWQMRISKSKTVAGERDLPIHPNLIAAGLIEYLEDLRQIWPDATTLFPYMKPVNGRLTHRFSQDFGIHRKLLGIDLNKDFHSFRTTVIGQLKIKNVPQDIREEFVGHESGKKTDVHTRSYAIKTKFGAVKIANEVFPALQFQDVSPNYSRNMFKQHLLKAKGKL